MLSRRFRPLLHASRCESLHSHSTADIIRTSRALTSASAVWPKSSATLANSRATTLSHSLQRPFLSLNPVHRVCNMSSSSTNNLAAQLPTFEKTPLPDASSNPLGQGKYVSTAACLIIGDEVLNGKTKDSNSNYFAKFCFNLGIDLKRIEVIPDDEEVIVEAARRLSAQHDLVISSGGIGPTPDDITYQSMAKAFDAEPLQYHDETVRRMAENLKARQVDTSTITEEMITARKRMALFPSKNVEVIFPTEKLWVPVVRMGGKLCILPGVPRLFEALIDGMEQYIPLDPNKPKPYRVLIHTSLPESNISPFLVKLTEKCKPLNIKVGSYPKWNNGVDVSMIGDNLETLQSLIAEVEQEVKGKLISQGQIGSTSESQDQDQTQAQSKGKI